MANKRWFVLNASAVDEAVKDCDPRHREVTGGNTLSVAWSTDRSKAIIKCDGADKEWRRGRPWIAAALLVLDSDTQPVFAAKDFATPEWQPKDSGK